MARVAAIRCTDDCDDLIEMRVQRFAGCLDGFDPMDARCCPARACPRVQVELLLNDVVAATLADGAGEVHPPIDGLRPGIDRDVCGNGVNDRLVLHVAMPFSCAVARLGFAVGRGPAQPVVAWLLITQATDASC